MVVSVFLVSGVAPAQSIDGPLPKLALTRDLIIAQPPDGTEGLIAVRDIAVDRTGRIFVLDWQEKRVHVFDDRGRPVRTVGRPGGGPGEFDNVSRLQIQRDTLWVMGGSDKRVSGFDVRTFGHRSFQAGGVPILGGIASAVMGVAPRGVVTSAITSGTSLAGFRNDAWHFEFVSETGAPLASIAKVATESQIRLKFDNYATSPPRGKRILITTTIQPFRNMPSVGTSADGTSLIVLEPAVVVSPHEAYMILRMLGLRGEQLFQRRLTYTPAPVTDADFERIVDSISSRRPASKQFPASYPDKRMVRDSIVRPKYWSPVFSMHVGSDNTIWLKMQGPQYPSNSYVRLSSIGMPDAIVTLPKGFTFVSASRDRVWGWRRDSDDLPVVERYRVQ